MKYLIFLLLIGCGTDYTIVEDTTCVERKLVFKCKYDYDTVAMCDTSKECQEICDKARKNE